MRRRATKGNSGLGHGMETLFRTASADQSCVESATTAMLIGTGIAVLVLLGAAGFTWWLIRQQPNRARQMRALIPAFGAAGVLTLGPILFFSVMGMTTHRISVEDQALVFEGCDGFTPFSERIAFAEIDHMSHQSRRTGNRSSRVVDELVIRIKGRDESRTIPLSTDPEVLNHALLARVMPRQALDDYRDSLARRGVTIPPGLAAP